MQAETPNSNAIALELGFKGSRDYLQGPDLLAGLLDALACLGIKADGAGEEPKPTTAFENWA